jgi:hypothetical protein
VNGAEQELSDEGLYDFLQNGSTGRSDAHEQELYIGSVEAGEASEGQRAAEGDSEEGVALATNGELKMARALQVFNAGEQPRRIAGVARSLGSPAVTVRPLEQSGSTVAIIVAWELCWYRYEVDLGDEAAGVRLVSQGMELEELSDEDRLANAGADEHGTLSPLALSQGH